MKMKRKLLSLLLALCLAIALVPMSAFAEESVADSWDGTTDTSWYTSSPDASEYHISTAEQLAGLAQLVNADPGTTNFAGKTFYLDNDIDLSGHEWISIGTVLGGDYPEYSFCGVFDGHGHVISNLYSHESYIEGADESHNLLRNALFGSVYNGEVKNLGVANAEIWIDPKDDSAAGKGILVDWMGKSKITNCWTSGSIYSGTKIEKNIGGIVGVTMQGCTISGCYSTATLTGNFTNSEGYYTEPDPANWPFDTIGGIVGARFDGNLTVTDCWFDGKIVVNSITAAVGGIVGYTDDQLGSGTVNNCMVTTTDMGVDKDGNTCWVAYALGGTVKNCYWPNDTKYGPSPLAYGEGTAVTDFTSADVLAGLKTNASAGVEWVAGIGHPTFVWDDNNILADYTAVDAAIASAVALDGSLYTNYSAVEDSINAVSRVKSKAQQTEVDAMAKAIEDAIAALQYKGANYTKVDAAIDKAKALNKDNYKDFSGVEAAVNAVVRGKNITKQSEVDAMATAIEDAITALVYKDADYTKVDEAIAKVNALNKDNYKEFSGVEAAVKAVVRGKNITEQSEVDKMAKAIEKAIAALQYKGADYTKVDAAIAKVNALNKDNYKDFSGVEAAVNAVVRDKNITEQSEVDKMAKAIEKAIAALQYKGADYTKVDAAIAKAKALNKDNYKDFSGVEAAVKAVVRGKNITKQSEVDAMAKAIEDAITALQYKGADYTNVDAAIAKAKALNKDNYKDFSGVEAAVKAVVRGKNITEQSEVDKMAKAIEKAIDALQYKGADYTKVDAAIAKAKALNKDNYKDFSGVEAAVKAVVRGKNITEQSEVDKMAKAIEKAIDALQYKGADYTKVEAAIAKAKALNKDNYKDFSGVEAAVNAVDRDKNVTEQSEVDKMAKAIEKAIDSLQYKGADYTKVEAAIAKAKALNKDNYKDFSGVDDAVKAVVRGNDITKQTEVDAMAKAIDDAISVLQYKDSDYTKVDAVIAKAPEPSIASGNNNNTNTNGGRVTGTSDSSKNTDSRNNSDTEIKPYIKDDSGKEGWDVINSQLDEAKSGETVTVVMNGTTVVPKDIFDSIKGEDVTLVLDMGDGISWKINGKDITDAAGDIDFGVTVGADAGKSIPVDVINNVTGERYYMNLSLAYDGEFGFTARLTINMEAKNTGLYANLFYYNEQTGKLEFVSAGLIDADGNVELEFTHASDYTIVIDADVMDGGNKDSINTTKDNENAEDNTTIPASNADNAKSDAWNPAIIIIIGICILLIVFGAVLYVRKKSGSEEE